MKEKPDADLLEKAKAIAFKKGVKGFEPWQIELSEQIAQAMQEVRDKAKKAGMKLVYKRVTKSSVPLLEMFANIEDEVFDYAQYEKK